MDGADLCPPGSVEAILSLVHELVRCVAMGDRCQPAGSCRGCSGRGSLECTNVCRPVPVHQDSVVSCWRCADRETEGAFVLKRDAHTGIATAKVMSG